MPSPDVDKKPAPPLPEWLADEYPFARHTMHVEGRDIHFVDEGEGPAVLLMHGNPTWGFLYRHVIRRLRDAKVRCIVPDLFGFGLSEKPSAWRAHTLTAHARTMGRLLQALVDDDVVLVGQDWGGPIVLGAGREAGLPIKGIVLGNTAVLRPARPFRSKPFHRLSQLPVVSDALFRGGNLPVTLMNRVQHQRLGRVTQAAYRYPFLRIKDRAGPLALARMVPNAEDHPSTQAMDDICAFVEQVAAPVTLVWGRNDPMLGRTLGRHRRAFPTARVVDTVAGHFLQEEVPDVLADEILRAVRAR